MMPHKAQSLAQKELVYSEQNTCFMEKEAKSLKTKFNEIYQ